MKTKDYDDEPQAASFTVDLGGIKLPGGVARKIDRDIRKSVLNALAEVDFEGEIGFKLPPDLWGIIIDPERLGPRFRA